MSYFTMIDGPSAAIVLGGTALGTVLRCGIWRSGAALRGLLGAIRPTFNADRARSQLALQVQEIHREGLLRAEPRHFGDEEFDEVADTLIGERTIDALLAKHRAHNATRRARAEMAASTFSEAAELAPVFGLAGTLIALGRMSAATEPGALISNSIPMAIVTTFYGLMTAHLLLAPIARLIERRSEKEELQRQKLVDWLALELVREQACRPMPREQLAA